MSEIIHGQVLYLLAATCCGMACMFFYSIIRIFRMLIRHSMIVKIVLDIIFWAAMSIPVFYVFYKINSGIIRWYGIVMLFLGAILYEKGIYCPVKKIIDKVLKKVYNKNIFCIKKSLKNRCLKRGW